MFFLELGVSDDQLEEFNIEMADQRPKSTVELVSHLANLPVLPSMMTSEQKAQSAQRTAAQQDQERRHARAEKECQEVEDLGKRRAAQLVKTNRDLIQARKDLEDMEIRKNRQRDQSRERSRRHRRSRSHQRSKDRKRSRDHRRRRTRTPENSQPSSSSSRVDKPSVNKVSTAQKEPNKRVTLETEKPSSQSRQVNSNESSQKMSMSAVNVPGQSQDVPK